MNNKTIMFWQYCASLIVALIAEELFGWGTICIIFLSTCVIIDVLYELLNQKAKPRRRTSSRTIKR